MEKKETINKMMFQKGGSNSTCVRISIPITWVRELGFTPENRLAKLILEDNKIIIKKN